MNDYALLSLLIQDPKYWKLYHRNLAEYEWEDDWIKSVYQVYSKFSEKHQAPITCPDKLFWVCQKSIKTQMSEEQRETLKSTVDCLFSMDLDAVDRMQVAEYLLDVRRQAIAEKLMTGDTDDWEAAQKEIADIIRVKSMQTASSELLFSDEAMEDPLEKVKEEEGEPISTGSCLLDELMNGGWYRGKQVVFLGLPGFGKTYFQIHFAVQAAKAGHRVVYIALDNTKGEMRKRIYSCSAGIPFSDLKTIKKNEYRDKLKALNIGSDKFILVMGHRKRTTMAEIQSELDRIVETIGPIDMICLDYIDVVKSSNSKREQYQDLDEAYAEHAGWGTIYNAVMVTASQGNRGGFGKPHLDQNDMAGAFAKNNHAAYVISVNQSGSDKAVERCWLAFLKVREEQARYRKAFIMKRSTGEVLDDPSAIVWLDAEVAQKEYKKNAARSTAEKLRKAKLVRPKRDSEEEEGQIAA